MRDIMRADQDGREGGEELGEVEEWNCIDKDIHFQ